MYFFLLKKAKAKTELPKKEKNVRQRRQNTWDRWGEMTGNLLRICAVPKKDQKKG